MPQSLLLYPMPYQSITEENIEILVRSFYRQVLDDKILAPFFIAKLGNDFQGHAWEEHLSLLTEFWKFVALGYDGYSGNPLEPHMHINDINKEAFEQWLKLFHHTVDICYTPSTGKYLKEKSLDIAQNFMRRLNIQP